MSEIHLLEDENALSELNNNISDDGQTRVSLKKEELQLFVIREVHRTVHRVVEEKLVPFFSKVVKQEIELVGEKILTSLKQNSGSGISSSESRNFQLKFLSKLSLPEYTGIHIKGEGNTPIKIALVDGITEKVVDSGPEASAKVEIVVVKEDFDYDRRGNWTLEEFNNKIVTEMEGRKSLLTGNVYLYLKEGIGFVGEISFTHNASWMKSCKLRLGAKVVDNLNGTRVREAITESFTIRDRRLTSNEKHYPPSLDDEVWRLKNIGKGGPFHQRLDREAIKTVKHFLTEWNMNPKRLQDILGKTMTANLLETIMDHARTCILDKKLYLYPPFSSQKKTGVVFNVIGQVMGLLSECCYIPNDALSEAQKVDAHKLVVSALEHTEDIQSFDDETSMHARFQFLNATCPSNSIRQESQLVVSAVEHMEDVQSFDDETSMHASFQFLNATCPSNSTRKESPGGCYFEAPNTDSGHDHTRPSTSSCTNEVISFDAETSVFHTSWHLFGAAQPTNSAWLENPSCCNFESHFDDAYCQPSTSSLDIGSIIGFGSGSASGFNEFGLHNVENVDLIKDQPLSFPSYPINPLLFYSESMPVQLFHEDDHCRYLSTDHSLQYQNSNLESQGDLQSVVNGCMSARAAAVDKAQKRWTMIFNVLKWNSKRKIVTSKTVSSVRIHAPKRPKIC